MAAATCSEGRWTWVSMATGPVPAASKCVGIPTAITKKGCTPTSTNQPAPPEQPSRLGVQAGRARAGARRRGRRPRGRRRRRAARCPARPPSTRRSCTPRERASSSMAGVRSTPSTGKSPRVRSQAAVRPEPHPRSAARVHPLPGDRADALQEREVHDVLDGLLVGRRPGRVAHAHRQRRVVAAVEPQRSSGPAPTVQRMWARAWTGSSDVAVSPASSARAKSRSAPRGRRAGRRSRAPLGAARRCAGTAGGTGR